MKPKTIVLMVVAVACGLGASYMTSKLLADRQEGPAEEMVPVLVAKIRVPGWTPIKDPEKYFEVKMLPEGAVSKKSLRTFDDVKNQRLNKPLDPERAAMQDDLLSKEQASVADGLLPGMRAIAVKVNQESLAGGFVLPGSRVDVICTTRSSDPTSEIILQSMLVLAVDMQSDRNPEQKSILGQTVTLAATVEEATDLALASSIGELRLLPKSSGDTKRITNAVARRNTLGKRSTGADGTDKVEGGPTTSVVKTALPPLTDVAPPPVKEEPVAPVEKPRRKHVMTIINGSVREKAVFVDGEGDDEESTPAQPPRKVEAPVAKPEVKTEQPKPVQVVPAPAVRTPRTRR